MGNRMLEWGCGFAVVAAIGSRLGLDVVGIESEALLLKQARQTLIDFDTPVDLVCGNFLPHGAEALSHNPDFPSLGHEVENAYDLMGLDLDDFALVFGYPWPGVEVFHQAVFERYATRLTAGVGRQPLLHEGQPALGHLVVQRHRTAEGLHQVPRVDAQLGALPVGLGHLVVGLGVPVVEQVVGVRAEV